MLKKVLIANRGEIAIRITRTAKRLGLATVAVYSAADRGALHVRHADEAVDIGAAPAAQSYLRADHLITAARDHGCDCIHPGYGFLSENADFAAACRDAGIIFVGPTPDAMRALGGKAAAKDLAIAAGVPVVPGYQGSAQDLATFTREARRIGYPLLIKAVAGGGGRGMRVVDSETQLATARTAAMQEAEASFGDGRILLERLVATPRHIEVQVAGDTQGNVVHMFERDCSLQRRHQKVIEEAPAPGMSQTLRARLTDAAVTLAHQARYTGVGTVEFLIEGGSLDADARWYFIEMNTRLQVEHPVTEAITGLDLVEWQFRIAAGEPLPLRQQQIRMHGHAIEARLNAEDPATGFLPSVGRVVAFAPPAGEHLRIETGITSGSVVTPYYDSMVAKIIAAAPDRATARDRLADALERTHLLGLPTNARFLRALLDADDVRAGSADTGFIARHLDALTQVPDSTRSATLAAAAAALITARANTPSAPWQSNDAFALTTAPRHVLYTFTADDHHIEACATWAGPTMSVTVDGITAPSDPERVAATSDGNTAWACVDLHHAALAWPTYAAEAATQSGGTMTAPIDGRVTAVLVSVGETVADGQRIATVEAMKMEHVLTAPHAGRVVRIDVAVGAQVARGSVIAEIEAP
jgi:3-methylcrotonyl-CoA carboxylase alpha subunit